MTTPTPSPQAEAVARKLTKAERKAISNSFVASWGETFVPTSTRMDVRWRLVGKGILSKRPAQPFLKLGLAVKALLEQEASR